MATKDQQFELADGLMAMGFALRKPRSADEYGPSAQWRILALINGETVRVVEGTFAECSRFFQGLVYAGYKG